MSTRLYTILRNYLSKTSFFWKYRHLLQPEVWDSYKNDSINSRRGYYNELLDRYDLNSVFEFGCASGPNFLAIYKSNKNICFFGYDISKKAISSIPYEDGHSRLCFTSSLSNDKLQEYLKINNLKFFDLSIFDRVLYMISEEELKNMLNKYSRYFNYIVIDDFHSEVPVWDNEKYIYAKNYTKIFSEFNFHLIEINDSELPSSTAKEYAKRLILKKNK